MLLRILKRAGIVALVMIWIFLGGYLILGTFLFPEYPWWGIVIHLIVGVFYVALSEEVLSLMTTGRLSDLKIRSWP